MHITENLIHEDIDLCFVSETYANVGDKLMIIPGYKIIRSERPSFGGGVAILHKSEINCDLLSETDFTDRDKSEHQPEFLLVSVKIRKYKPYLIACVY
jgi:hypothetical protein